MKTGAHTDAPVDALQSKTKSVFYKKDIRTKKDTCFNVDVRIYNK